MLSFLMVMNNWTICCATMSYNCNYADHNFYYYFLFCFSILLFRCLDGEIKMCISLEWKSTIVIRDLSSGVGFHKRDSPVNKVVTDY